jgi:hypothetical protein
MTGLTSTTRQKPISPPTKVKSRSFMSVLISSLDGSQLYIQPQITLEFSQIGNYRVVVQSDVGN